MWGINLIVKTPSIIPNATAKETTTPVNHPINPKNLLKKLFFVILFKDYIFSIGSIPIRVSDLPKTCLNDLTKSILKFCFSEPITGQA